MTTLTTEADWMALAVEDLAKGSAETWQLDISEVNTVYRPHLNNNARIQIIFGGSSSGKSHFALGQRLVHDVVHNRRNYLVCRAVGRDNRRSTFVQVVRAIREYGIYDDFKINRSELVITHNSGYQIIFAGLDDTEKLKSITTQKGALTDVLIEEATQAKRDDIRQLLRRQRGGELDVPKRLHLLFNPILREHHLYHDYFAPNGWTDGKDYLESDGLTILKTTYKDNAHLAQDEIDVLENESDPYWYDVYTLGNFGVLGDVIFTNWKTETFTDKQRRQFTNIRNGLDFGFGSDPAAMVQAHFDKRNKRIYIFGEMFGHGMTNAVLADEIKPFIDNSSVVCDSAEPKSIAELRLLGIHAVGAKKGKDSVRYGIQWLQQHEIIVDESCVNIIGELRTYQRKKDKNGNALPEPIDKNNHGIDALRYAFEQDMAQSNQSGSLVFRTK